MELLISLQKGYGDSTGEGKSEAESQWVAAILLPTASRQNYEQARSMFIVRS